MLSRKNIAKCNNNNNNLMINASTLSLSILSLCEGANHKKNKQISQFTLNP